MRRHLLLNYLSWPEYQALLYAINPKAEEILIQSGTAVYTYIKKSYYLYRKAVKSQLQGAKSKIYFSIDI